jgi:PAS domain S-box-containing protein
LARELTNYPAPPVVGILRLECYQPRSLSDPNVQRTERRTATGIVDPASQAGTRPSEDSSAPDSVEEALQRQRRAEEIILDSVPAFVWYKDRENRIVHANRAAAATIGKTPAELAGASTYDLYPDQAAAYYADDLDVITSGQPKLGIIEQMRVASGEQRWVRTDKIPYRDEHGAVTGVIVFAVDITEHKRVEAALEQTRDELEHRVQERTAELAGLVETLRAEIAERRLAEERLALSLWATNLGLWDWDMRTDRVVYDRRYAEMLGYRPEDIEPTFQDWESRVHPDDLPFALKLLSDHVRDRLTPHYESEHRVRTRGGDYRWALVHGQVAEWGPDGRPSRMTGTFRDVTARKGFEEQIRRQQAELAHVQRLQTLEGMAAELAHEINQPLGAIANFANGLAARLRKEPVQDAAMLDVAEEISAQALRAGRVLQRVREFTRKEPPRRVSSDINRVIRDAAHLIEPDARHYQIRLSLSLDEHLPPVLVDPIQVEQVILNLLRNGVEAIAAAGRGRDELAIDSALNAEGQVEVTVYDTGHGIPGPVLERLFEPFFTTKREGMGMGLSISRSIIEAHGGNLCAPETSKRGTTFRFTLPAAHDDATA